MRIGIVGAGRVGCSLAIALSKKGLPAVGVYSRNADSIRTVREKAVFTVYKDTGALVEGSDTVLITVPDTRIEEVSKEIARASQPDALAGKVFLHCSGALTATVLSDLREKGGFTGSLHPIQTFPDRTESWASMYHICFGFEGMPEAEAAAEEVTRLLDGSMLRVGPGGKSLYHAAACVLSNYMVTLSHTASGLLERAGIGREEGLVAFAPLLRSTVENILKAGSTAALTGPISRGDTATVASHLEAMERLFPEGIELYRNMGRETVLVALEKGTVDDESSRELLRILDGHK